MKKALAAHYIAAVVFLGLIIARADVIEVTAFPLWTPTAITVTQDQVLGFSVSGGPWDWGFGPVGADGSFSLGAGWDEWIPNDRHGQLIGYVGVDPMNDRNQFGAEVTNPGRFFVIGAAGGMLTMPTGGSLWLGFNDDRQSNNTYDNSGTMTVTVGSTVPDGGVSLPILAGAIGLLAFLHRCKEYPRCHAKHHL